MVRRTRYRARRRSGGRWVLVFIVACVIVAILAALIYLPRIFFSSGTPSRASDDAYCSAKPADGPSYSLMPEQAQNAELIANIAINRGLPDHAVTVAIATAMQESRITNLSYGDLDSIGLFQQRPSQGWGTVEQVSDMTYATNIFYDHLMQVPDWETIPIEDAAQEVQRSGYPDLYATWDAMAHAWAAGLTGEFGATISCALEPATSSDADGLIAALPVAYPSVTAATAPATAEGNGNNSSDGTTITVALPDGLSADDHNRLCWQVTGWLVTHARQYGINALHANGMEWNRKDGVWTGNETAEQTITVTLV